MHDTELYDDELDLPEEDLEEEDDGGSGLAGFVAGIALGGLIGAGVALLFAPAKGEKIRRRLGRRARDLGEDALEELDHARVRGRRELHRKRRHLKTKIRNTLSDLG